VKPRVGCWGWMLICHDVEVGNDGNVEEACETPGLYFSGCCAFLNLMTGMILGGGMVVTHYM